jgi:hypothetical protein
LTFKPRIRNLDILLEESRVIPVNQLRPGTVVYVWFGIFRHKGIVTNRWWNGYPMVIANSWTTNGVAEIPWSDFAGTEMVFVEGYPSNLRPHQVLENARSMIGHRYDAVQSNCEHFVCLCHGLEPYSPQLAGVVIAAAVVAALAVAARA